MKYVEPLNSNRYPEREGHYVTANPNTAIVGSTVPAEAIEHGMREIVHVIVEAGLTPSGTDLTQLAQAIRALLGGPYLPLAGGTMVGDINTEDGAEFHGNVDSATKLKNKRKINGVNFDGTEDVNIECFLPLDGGTMTGDIIMSNNSELCGNADSATKLKNERTINGVGFDGTKNISIPEYTQKSLLGNGYIKFACGLIFQWGYANAAGTVTFPISFPNTAFIGLFSTDASDEDETVPASAFGARHLSRTGMTVGSWYGGYWLAVGY
ncbi:MAG: hypothetical protein Q4C86_07725 [bacterium]|nr:hypothetical protein [bacterium]